MNGQMNGQMNGAEMAESIPVIDVAPACGRRPETTPLTPAIVPLR